MLVFTSAARPNEMAKITALVAKCPMFRCREGRLKPDERFDLEVQNRVIGVCVRCYRDFRGGESNVRASHS